MTFFLYLYYIQALLLTLYAMNSITLRKIWHRDAFRIGIFFERDFSVISVLKKHKAEFSRTKLCWYVDYTTANYQLLLTLFPDLKIVKSVVHSEPTLVTHSFERNSVRHIFIGQP